jgi:hypothetical protein
MPLPENSHPKEIYSLAAKRANTPSPGDFPWTARNFREGKGLGYSCATVAWCLGVTTSLVNYYSSFLGREH